jgi:hypothetical protein
MVNVPNVDIHFVARSQDNMVKVEATAAGRAIGSVEPGQYRPIESLLNVGDAALIS